MKVEEWARQCTYQDVEMLIRSRVQKFMEKYGNRATSFEDLFQEACVIFMEAYAKYGREKAAFSTWLCVKIHYGLLQLLQSRKMLNYPIIPSEILDLLPAKPRSFRLKAFKEDLSKDARVVVGLAFRIEENTPTRIKRRIKETLREKGWTLNRIRSVFSEIKEALP